jgi:methylenetetrahydrofolate dehydrogenase (NADP+)/methenyltetrahydrofolate cyclohydrolase
MRIKLTVKSVIQIQERIKMAKIIDGKRISSEVREEIADCTLKIKAEQGCTPGLAVIIVGNDPASQVYVRNKKRACEQVGFYSEVYELPEMTSQEELCTLVDQLNKDSKIHGILVQLPLPRHLDENDILLRIKPEKDVDAFHPYNVGKIMIGNYDLLPCTPAGVMVLLKKSGIDVSGKRCVVVGRSNIVGKPMAMLLMQANGTVTVCHSRTQGLADICREADVLVVSMGKPEFITGDMVKDGAVVVDVGINRLADGRLVGDVNFAEVEPKASYITPVPGGVGPMTITMLLQNTLTAAQKVNKCK